MSSTILACLVIGAIGGALYFGPKGPKRDNAPTRFFGVLFIAVAVLFAVATFATFTTGMVVALIVLFIGTVTLLGVKSWGWKIPFILLLVVLFFTIGGLLDFYPADSFPNMIVSMIADGVKSMAETISSQAFK